MKPLLIALVALGTFASAATAQEVIYLVRHTERLDQSQDSPLSAAGEARAQKLVIALRDAGITHIFTTNLKRTMQTAAPLAAALKVTPTALASGDVDAVASALRSLGPHDRALVVGHSNTVPVILFNLGAAPAVTIADAEHDNLFIVVPRKDSAPAFMRLKY